MTYQSTAHNKMRVLLSLNRLMRISSTKSHKRMNSLTVFVGRMMSYAGRNDGIRRENDELREEVGYLKRAIANPGW